MRARRTIFLVLLGAATALMVVSASRTWREVNAFVGIEGTASAGSGVRVTGVAPGSPADEVGVREGDRLLAVGGAPVRSWLVAENALAGARPDGKLGLRVVQDGQVRSFSVEPRPRIVWFPGRILAAAVGWLFVLGGLAVVLRPRGSPADRSYALCCLAGALLLGVSWSSRAGELDWVLFWVDRVARLLLPALWVHFVLDVTKAGSRLRRWIPAAYAPAAALLIAEIHLVGLGGALRAADPVRVLDAVQSRLELGWIGAGFLIGLALLAFAGRKHDVPAVRAQRRWMLVGSALGLVPFVAASALPRLLFGVEPSWSWAALPFLAAVPLTFTGAVLEYRLMDLSLFARRALAATAMLGMSVVVFSGLWTLADLVLPTIIEPANYAPILLAAAVTVLLAPGIRAASRDLVGRLYYRRRYSFRRALGRVARDLNAERHLPRLRQVLEQRVAEALDADPVHLLLVDEQRELRVPVSGEARGRLPETVSERLASGGNVALADVFEAPTALPSLHEGGVRWLTPLRVEQRLIAVLAVGRRQPGQPFDSDDIDLLRSVADHAAAAVAGALNLHRLEEQIGLVERLQAQTSAIIESSPIGLAVVDSSERIREWNTAIERLVGADREQVCGRHYRHVLPDGLATTLRDAIRARASFRRAFRVRIHGGDDERLINLTVTSMSPPGDRQAWLLTVDDVTARVRLEEQLIQQDRLASVGLLAAGVAHEVNTPLTGISSYAQFLLDETPPTDSRRAMLEKIVAQAERASGIARALLGISRPERRSCPPERVDLAELAEETVGFLGPRIRRANATVIVSRESQDVLARGDRARLQQVLINLLINAIDAVEPAGRVVISASREEGDTARLDVSDDGPGIPPDVVPRVFDPFFTTKEAGRGTGLGLSISYAIVREHGGSLKVDSAPSRGTRMVVRLPAAAEGGASQRAAG